MSNKTQIKNNLPNRIRVNNIKHAWRELNKTCNHIKNLKQIIFKLEHKLESKHYRQDSFYRQRPQPPFTINNYKKLLKEYQALAEADRNRLNMYSSEIAQHTC